MRRHVLVLLVAAAALLAGCTGGTPAASRDGDADGDGLTDAFESVVGWNVTVETRDGPDTRAVKPSPSRPDSDGDGLSDADEYRLGTDPVNVDTDADGLLDGESMPATGRVRDAFLEWGVLPDPARVGWFLGEASLCEGYGQLSPTRWDSDRPRPDGLGDGEELQPWNVTVLGRTYAVKSDPCVSDSDGDGLDDGKERAVGSDPGKRDTDGDGVVDGLDVDPMTDVGVRVTVERVTLVDEPGNATLRLVVNVDGHQETRDRTAALGANEVALAVSRDVDDAKDPVSDTAPVRVFVRATLVEADGSTRPLDLGDGGEGTFELTYDLVGGLVTGAAGDGAARGALEAAGADGGIRLTFSRIAT